MAGSRLKWSELIKPELLSEAIDGTVLVRAHHVTSSIDEKSLGPRIVDVSGEPHIEELMGIADMLITDYSSVAIDFEIDGQTSYPLYSRSPPIRV